MDGVDYRYCGYDPASGFHLIFKHDEAIFGGVLLAQRTGLVLPAGQRILFAPDTVLYFAMVQPDGLDGEEWHVFSTRSGQIWKGVSGITAMHPTLKREYMVADLTDPHWSAAGELQATATCYALRSRSQIVTLRKQGGTFVWTPIVACPP